MNRKVLGMLGGIWLCLTSCSSETNPPQTTPEIKKTVAIKSKIGKKLFLEHCAACHNTNMVDDMTGPALYGVESRWSNRGELIQFVQNPQELINNNHERAAKVAALWPSEMTAFSQLDSSAIEEILAFVKEKGALAN